MKISQHVFRDGLLESDGLRTLAAVEPNLVLVFGSWTSFARPGFHATLRKAFPEAHLAGCTTAGEIAGERVFDGACVVTAIRFAATALKIARADIGVMEDSLAMGERVGKALDGPELRGILLFCKGLDVNGSAVIQGVSGAVRAGVAITGGLAGDGGAFQRTWVLDDHGVSDTGLVGIGFYGDGVRIGYGSYGGWEPFGPARRVTRCQGNLLFELDGEPALNVYKRYLGDYAKNLPASGLLFPFEMLGEDHGRLGLIRTILGIDEAAGSLILAGDIDPNGFLRLMHASTDALVNGAEAAAEATRQMVAECGAGLAILVSCVGRKLVMGDHVDEEVEVVSQALAAGTVTTGFYSYGEISPFSATTDCKLHNQTMTITFLAEAAE
ncbi:MAG: FIST C-terminal domain-containing protein [Magnetococcales bacterium]|nr:FIST C-terminal domain-containing protein [Magnetococcales bacterium]